MIALSHVTKSFPQGRSAVTALQDVSLQIQDHELFGIVGESGSGKSTLLRLINHLEAPTSGTVLVDGQDLGALSPRELRVRRRGIGMVFQQFNLLANSTVFDNVARPLRLQRRREPDTVMQMLDFVKMAGHRHKHPSQLSGGEKQRVAIARALSTRPQILLCDEPTSALDPGLAAEVVAVLGALATEGMTMLMATHDLRLAAQIASQTVFLQDGAIIESGPSQALFQNPQDPRTRQFVATLTGEAGAL